MSGQLKQFGTAAALGALGMTMASLVFAQSGDIERQFDVQAGGTLVIEADAGPIKIESWDQPQVSVRVMDHEAYSVSFEQTGDRIEVLAEDARGRSRIRFEARVPRQFNLDLDTGGGAIDIGEMIGDVDADTSGGSITVQRVQDGDVVADTSGGRIVVREVFNGNVSADTSGGQIEIGRVVGNVEADTSGGSIHIGDVDGDVVADTSGGGIDVGRVTGNVLLDTSGGSITAGYAGGTLSADTSGGNITLQGSDGLLTADTSGGTIRVARSGGPVSVATSGGNIYLGPINGYIEAETSGGSIEAELGVVGPGQDAHIELTSSGGDIELRLPADHGATVSARIQVSRIARGDYRIYTDFPLAISGQENDLVIGRGDINGGGDMVRLQTNNGDIRIVRTN